MDYEQIYQKAAVQYHELVSAEDCNHRLLPAIERIAPLAGQRVLDVGTGTGRIMLLAAKSALSVVGVDSSEAMISVARQSIKDMYATGCRLCVGDARSLPLKSQCADVVIAAWVFGHFRSWMPDNWRRSVGKALTEMRRAVRPGGTIIVIETLGTGSELPAPPTQELGEYYSWLHSDQGFQCTCLRTDYSFSDVATATRVIRFFFGESLADLVRTKRWTCVPECTGVWWQRQETMSLLGRASLLPSGRT